MLVAQEKLTLLERTNLMKKLKIQMKNRRTFYLAGISGVGKTELLSYCYWECTAPRKVFIDATEEMYSDIIRKLARCLGVAMTVEKKRKTIPELQLEILKGEEMYIFLDNFHKLNPKQCDYFLKLNRFCKIYLSIDEKFLKKEEQKELIQGRERIKVLPIPVKSREFFAKFVLGKLKNREIDPRELAKNSRGIPRRFWNLAKGEELYRSADDRIQEEEINISVIVVAVLSMATALRYFARGTGEKDLYILSAVLIAFFGLIKCFIREVNKK